MSDSEEHLVAVIARAKPEVNLDARRKELQREILSILRRQTKLEAKLERKRKELRDLG